LKKLADPISTKIENSLFLLKFATLMRSIWRIFKKMRYFGALWSIYRLPSGRAARGRLVAFLCFTSSA
jgi:hypothetical protein